MFAAAAECGVSRTGPEANGAERPQQDAGGAVGGKTDLRFLLVNLTQDRLRKLALFILEKKMWH